MRWSRLENYFTAPRGFVAPSFAWDWDKLDLGLRVTIIRKLDLTLEYSFHDIAASRVIQHDEALRRCGSLLVTGGSSFEQGSRGRHFGT